MSGKKAVSCVGATFPDMSEQLHLSHQGGCGFGSGLVIRSPHVRAQRAKPEHGTQAVLVLVPTLPALCRKDVETIDESLNWIKGTKDIEGLLPLSPCLDH